MILNSIISFLSVLIGGAITRLVARQYYQKASVELRQEAQRLRETTAMILRGLHNSGVFEVRFDPNTGDPVGLNIKRTVTDSLAATDNVDPSIEQGE